MNPSRPFILRPVATSLLMLAILLAGIIAYRLLPISALPPFLKTYIDRLNFSFTDYLRHEKDSSTELHQWIRRNYLSLRDLELKLTSPR